MKGFKYLEERLQETILDPIDEVSKDFIIW